MTEALNLRAEDAGAAPILALWREAGRLEPAPSMQAHGYPPHLTLAIYEEAGRAELLRALDAAAEGRTALALTFTRIRWFEGLPLVLFVEPEPDPELAAIHAAIHAVIDPHRCHARYRPDRWTPHCTLALHIGAGNVAAAQALAARPFHPFAVRFDRVEWVRFPPAAVLASRRLAPRDG